MENILNATKEPKENIIPFISRYNFISPLDLEELLETLNDMGYLSDKGIEFRSAFWALLIKE